MLLTLVLFLICLIGLLHDTQVFISAEPLIPNPGVSAADFSDLPKAETAWGRHSTFGLKPTEPIFEQFSDLEFLETRAKITKPQILHFVYLYLDNDSIYWRNEGNRIDQPKEEFDFVIESVSKMVALKRYSSFDDLLDWLGVFDSYYCSNGIPTFFKDFVAGVSFNISQLEFKDISRKAVFKDNQFRDFSYKFYSRLGRNDYSGRVVLEHEPDRLLKILNPKNRFMRTFPIEQNLKKFADRFNNDAIKNATTNDKLVEAFWYSIMHSDFCEIVTEDFTQVCEDFTEISGTAEDIVHRAMFADDYTTWFADGDLFGLKELALNNSDNPLPLPLVQKISANYIVENQRMLDMFMFWILSALPSTIVGKDLETTCRLLLECSKPNSEFMRNHGKNTSAMLQPVIETLTKYRLDLQQKRQAMHDIESAYVHAYKNKTLIEEFLSELEAKTNKFNLGKLTEMSQMDYSDKTRRPTVIGISVVSVTLLSFVGLWWLTAKRKPKPAEEKKEKVESSAPAEPGMPVEAAMPPERARPTKPVKYKKVSRW